MSENELELPVEVEKKIVKGILNGYKSYLTARNRAHRDLDVDAAYAWVKGNHIDTYVERAIIDVDGVTCQHALAGYAWEYLQFKYSGEGKPALIIVRGSVAAKNNFNGQTPRKRAEYVQRLAEINRADADNGKLDGKLSGESVQLDLNIDDLVGSTNENQAPALSNIGHFYIVTYEINAEKEISSIKLAMPNPLKGTLFQVADLSSMMNETNVQFDADDYAGVRDDRIPDSTTEDDLPYNFEVPETGKTVTKK